MTPDNQIIKADAAGQVVLRGFTRRANPSDPWREVWLGFIDDHGSEETCIYRDANAIYLREQELAETLATIRLKIRYLQTRDESLASSLREIEQTIGAVLE